MESTPKNEDEKVILHRTAVIGNPQNFWLHSIKGGFDLTHPVKPTSPPVRPRVGLRTSTSPITISPAKSALIIIDMQNYFLSEALGRKKGAGHTACDNLVKYAVPAARKMGMRVIWLNWGLTDEEIGKMPPAVTRAFGFEVDGVAVDKFGELKGPEKPHKGLGSELGNVTLPSGENIDAGRLLMRDTWNAALYPPLDELYEEGSKLQQNPDVWLHKNRMSGMWGASTQCQEFLDEKGLKTMFFAGVNTDQCVSGTYTDAFSKGYDCVLVRDGCGTTSPSFAQDCIEYNAENTWGFMVTSEDLLKGAEAMED